MTTLRTAYTTRTHDGTKFLLWTCAAVGTQTHRNAIESKETILPLPTHYDPWQNKLSIANYILEFSHQ